MTATTDPRIAQAPHAEACYLEGPRFYECTRQHGHDGDHAASDGQRVVATWPACRVEGCTRDDGHDGQHITRGGQLIPAAGNGHPAWCDPAACIVDPTNGERIHRHATVRAHGSAVVSTTIAAGDDEPARLFLEVRDGDDLTPQQADAIAWQLVNTAARLHELTD